MGNRNMASEIAGRNNRRQFLKLAGYGTLGLLTTGGFWPLSDHSAAKQHPKTSPETEFLPDLDISLTAKPDEVAVLPGNPTQVWRYHAMLHKGDKNRIIELPHSYLGPIIKANQEEKIRVRFNNQLQDESIVHWHGLHVPAVMDGHPRYVVSQGQSYFYEFEIKNRAGTYWYHPHPTEEPASKYIRDWQAFFWFLMKKNNPWVCLTVNMTFLWSSRIEHSIRTISSYT
jgi:hypothetical protein